MTHQIAHCLPAVRRLGMLGTLAVVQMLVVGAARAKAQVLLPPLIEPSLTPFVEQASGAISPGVQEGVNYALMFEPISQLPPVDLVTPISFQDEPAESAPPIDQYDAVDTNNYYYGSPTQVPTVPWCAMCPTWYGWADAVIMFRDNQSRRQTLVENVNTNAALISSGDLEFAAATGLRAGLGMRLHDRWGLEFQFLGGLNHVASANVSGTNELALPGDLGLAVNNFFLADEADVRYESQLNSPEINLVFCRCCCDTETCYSREWFVGFRYLELNEELGIRSYDADESTSRYRVRTFNNLYGGQLGVRGRRCRGRWSLEALCKAGLFANNAKQVQDPIYDFPGIQFRSRRSAMDSDTAFVGEVNLTGIFHINGVWGLRAGYNAMWIEGVALAPDQLDFTNTASSGMNIATTGGVFLHGANIGLEARY